MSEQSASGTDQMFRRRGSWYEAEWIDCPRCRGSGENVECIDDLCHAQGRCMHGDNLCALCEGVGEITRELDRRWYSRDAFESVTLPDADLRRRHKLHEVARERYVDTDTDQPGDDDLVTDGGTSERVVIEGMDDADAAQVRDDLTDTGIREAAIERRDGGRRPWLVPAIGAAMLGAGTVATWIAARPDASAIRSIPTYLRELYIETDFIGATATGDAWMGTMLVVVGVALLAAWGWGR